MKKILVLMPLLLVAVACAPEPKEKLPDSDPEKTYYSVKLTPENSLITNDDTTTNYNVNLNFEM